MSHTEIHKNVWRSNAIYYQCRVTGTKSKADDVSLKAKDLITKAKAKADDLSRKAKAKTKDLVTKAKANADDLSLKAKAKNMLYSPRGVSRSRAWP